MIPEREAICRKCRMLPSIHHLDYPCCLQPIMPMNAEEWKLSGLDPKDPITREGYLKMMDIGMMEYCKNRMLNSADFLSWLNGGTRRANK